MHPTPSCVVPSELTEDLRSYELVDVRTPGEFEAGRLPHSRNRPLDQLETHVPALRAAQEQGRRLVLVCRTGNRATQAQSLLRGHGIDAEVLTGGVEGWRTDGRDVVVDVARWDMDRQVRLVAGSIVLAAVLASVAWSPAIVVAGALGAGLVFSALTNTCGMARVLAALPYNRSRKA